MRAKLSICVFAGLLILSACRNGEIRMRSSVDSSSDIYGVVTDDRGHRLRGVVVSDGYSCTVTDRNGEYQLSSCDYSSQVNISVPEAYEVPMSEGIPHFWQDLVSGQERYDFTLTPLPGGVEKKFNLVCIADPQCRYDYQVARFYSETVPDMAALVEASDLPCYGVALGDIGYNRNDLDVSPIFPMMKERFGRMGFPMFSVMGNHDNAVIFADEYSVDHDIAAQRFFENIFGPVNYSFNRGNAHIICMDDILFTRHDFYKHGFRDDQIEWLKQDLSYVPKDKAIIFCVHIPMRNEVQMQNVEQVFDILGGFTDHYHVMSGHWHTNNNFVYDSRYEHNQGAGMGNFWTCDICADGTPNGYAVYQLDGSEMANWYYKGTGCSADYQIRLYRASDVFMPEGDPNYQFACNGEDQIVASVFNVDDSWKISVYEDGAYSGDMEKLGGHDAWASGYIVGVMKRNNYVKDVPHLFYYTLKDKDAQVEVRATDPFGNVYVQSVFTSNQPEDYPTHE